MSYKKNSNYLYKNMVKAKQRLSAGIAAPALVVMGWLGMTFLPGTNAIAVSTGDYRACASRLLKAGITAEAAASACARALRPRDLSSCVAEIEDETEIAAVDALSTCTRAWRPEDVGACVVGISKNTKAGNQVLDKQLLNRTILSNCGLSLLPRRYAQCVVGLRLQIDNLAPTQAINTCIDASNYVSGYLPTFIPANKTDNTIFQPSFQTQPIPNNQIPNNQNSQ
jgi:hypothetical protein